MFVFVSLVRASGPGVWCGHVWSWVAHAEHSPPLPGFPKHPLPSPALGSARVRPWVSMPSIYRPQCFSCSVCSVTSYRVSEWVHEWMNGWTWWDCQGNWLQWINVLRHNHRNKLEVILKAKYFKTYLFLSLYLCWLENIFPLKCEQVIEYFTHDKFLLKVFNRLFFIALKNGLTLRTQKAFLYFV